MLVIICVVSQVGSWFSHLDCMKSQYYCWFFFIVVQNTLLICLNCWPFLWYNSFLCWPFFIPFRFWTPNHIEVVEHACGMGTLQMGEYVSNVSNGIDTFSIREPLGVCAGICPFNFPAMIPLWVCLTWPFLPCQIVSNRRLAPLITLNVSSLQWLQMFPIAVTCGNTFVLKPSEKDPGYFLLYHQKLSIIPPIPNYKTFWLF
jgi:hypothetical protein